MQLIGHAQQPLSPLNLNSVCRTLDQEIENTHQDLNIEWEKRNINVSIDHYRTADWVFSTPDCTLMHRSGDLSIDYAN